LMAAAAEKRMAGAGEGENKSGVLTRIFVKSGAN